MSTTAVDNGTASGQPCTDCGQPLTLVGHGLQWECLNMNCKPSGAVRVVVGTPVSYNPAKDDEKLQAMLTSPAESYGVPSRWIRCMAAEILALQSACRQWKEQFDAKDAACQQARAALTAATEYGQLKASQLTDQVTETLALRQQLTAAEQHSEVRRQALVHAVEVIQTWHNADVPVKQRSELWDIYWRNAPELKPIRAALLAKGETK